MKKIKSLNNIRDLCATTKQNKKIKPNRIFRSNSLKEIVQEDIEELRQLNIKYIVDLRSQEEVEVDFYQLPDDFVYYHISALKTKDGLENFYFLSLINENSTSQDIQDVSQFVRDGYKVLPFHNKAYQKIFDLMLEKEEGILFHCSSGKDRTGVIAALIFKLFDVDDQLIMEDYMLSNENVIGDLLENFNHYKLSPEVKETLIDCCLVHEELLNSSFDEILKKYRNFDEYFEKEYHLTKEKRDELKDKFLSV